MAASSDPGTSNPTGVIRLGSRKSPLAMAQAELAARAVQAQPGAPAVEIVPITSEGDRDLKTRLDRFSAPGIFTRALEEALLAGRIDAAVHSAKDLPSSLDEPFQLLGALQRDDPHDVLVARVGLFFAGLPEGARVGSCSPRRIAQLTRVRDDVQFLAVRGNLQTRLAKLDRGEVDALILAAAGLKRQGLEDRMTELLPFEVCLPAAGQGIIVMETLCDTSRSAVLAAAGVLESGICLEAERAVLRRLNVGCSAAVAVFATISKGTLRIEARVLDAAGTTMLESSTSEPLAADGAGSAAADATPPAGWSEDCRGRGAGPAHAAGTRLAEDLLAQGARKLL